MSNKKNQLQSRIISLKNVSTDFKYSLVEANLETLETELDNSKLRVSVLGEFNEGKSTFLNALLNLPKEKHLWMEMSESTSVMTEIKFGVVETGFAYHRDSDEITEFNLSKLKDYTATDIASEKYWKTEIFINNEMLKSGVIFIDTPGVNTLDQTKFETTISAIKNSHAAIFISSRTEIPLTQKQFIADSFLNDIGKLFCVLNLRDDYLSSEDYDELQNSFQKSLSEVNDLLKEKGIEAQLGNFHIINCYKALHGKNNNDRSSIDNSKIKTFEEKFIAFLATEKYDVILNRISTKFERIKKETNNLLKVGKESLNLDTAEYDGLIKKLNNDLTEVNLIENEIKNGVNDILSDVKSGYKDSWDIMLNREIKRLVKNKINLLDLSKPEIAQNNINNLQRKIEKRILEWMENQNSHSKSEIERRFKDYAKNIKSELDKLQGIVSDSYSDFNIDIDLQPEAQDQFLRSIVEVLIVIVIDILLPGGVLWAIIVRIFGKSMGDTIAKKVTEFILKIFNFFTNQVPYSERDLKAQLEAEFDTALDTLDTTFREKLNTAFETTERNLISQIEQNFSEKIRNIKIAVENAQKQRNDLAFDHKIQTEIYDKTIALVNNL